MRPESPDRPLPPTSDPSTVKHYVLRVRGDVEHACAAAREEGLNVEVQPETSTARGWLDQAALFGLLARMRLRGLEVAAAHRTRVPTAEQPPRVDGPDDEPDDEPDPSRGDR